MRIEFSVLNVFLNSEGFTVLTGYTLKVLIPNVLLQLDNAVLPILNPVYPVNLYLIDIIQIICHT